MRKISEYFFEVSGIYKRLLYLFASMPNFDTLVIPRLSADSIPEQKLMKDFYLALDYIDSLNVKLTFPLITLSLFKNGVYFGYLRDDKDTPVIQTLPTRYCRSRYKKDNRYTVEFNFDYFDREFVSAEEKVLALKQFPKEFQKEYNRYKSGAKKGMEKQWELLDSDYALCFKFPEETPFFLSIIVDLIELRQAKNIELSKDRLELFQLLVQKIPLDKEGELVFDLSEAAELHKNAVKMLTHNEGIDVLTTFAEMDMLNIKEARQVQKDNLLKTERSVFNEAGVSKMVFATEGNITLKFSLQKDEALFRLLWPQFSTWLSHVVNLTGKTNKKYSFEVWIPPVTMFNEEEMEKRYRTQATFGYAKLLPGIIGGMKQSALLSLIRFENDYLKLNEIMEPLKSSHTQSGKEAGRPGSPEEEKESGTLENEEKGSQGGES